MRLEGLIASTGSACLPSVQVGVASSMKILVPGDGSPASIRAIKLAINQVKTVPGDSLVIVNVQNLATLGLAEGAGIMPTAWIEQEEERAAT
jgi:hypothetical protein